MIRPYPFGFSPFRNPYFSSNYVHNANRNVNFTKNRANVYSPKVPKIQNFVDFEHTSPNNCAKAKANYQQNNSSIYNSNTNSNFLPNPSNTESSTISNSNDEIFHFFGFSFAFDDLLIIALLFFLYKEDVKDSYLYIALISLLFS